MKFAAAMSACAVLTGNAALCVFADAEQELPEVEVSEDVYAMIASFGYSEEQIARIAAESRVPDEYIAYFNVSPNSVQTGTASNVWLNVQMDSTSNYGSVINGLQCSSSSVFLNTSTNWVCSTYFSFNTSNLNAFQIPNIVRLPITGVSGVGDISTYVLNETYFNDISHGAVELGNVTRYIAASGDTTSIINTSDASRILTHYANILSGLGDSTWTEAAGVAADVNLDGSVNLLDANKILNYLEDPDETFF